MDSQFTYEVLVHRKKRCIYVVAIGKMSLENLKQMYASVLMDPQYESGMSRLWDITRLDLSLLTSDHLRSFVDFMMNEDLGVDTAYVAILVSREYQYGMCRMIQGLGRGVLSPNIFITRDVNEALAWIRRRRAADVNRQWEIPESISDRQLPAVPKDHR